MTYDEWDAEAGDLIHEFKCGLISEIEFQKEMERLQELWEEEGEG